MATTTKTEAALEAVQTSAETFDLPKGVKAENIARRLRALVENGTDRLMARALAVDAETIQVHQDAQTAKERDEAEKHAQSLVPDRLRAMTVQQLRDYAAEESLVIPDATSVKKDILAFLLAAYEESRKGK